GQQPSQHGVLVGGIDRGDRVVGDDQVPVNRRRQRAVLGDDVEAVAHLRRSLDQLLSQGEQLDFVGRLVGRVVHESSYSSLGPVADAPRGRALLFRTVPSLAQPRHFRQWVLYGTV